MSSAHYSIRKVTIALFLPLIATILLFSPQTRGVAFAQSTGTVTGTIYHDVAGTADPNQFQLFATPAQVSLFKGTTYISTTTTDANGHYTFTNLVAASYYVTVDNPDELAGFSDSEGKGVVEQTYGSSGTSTRDGPICAGRTEYVQQNATSIYSWRTDAQNGDHHTGPCYGGRDATLGFTDLTGNTNVAVRKHVIKITLTTGETLSGVDFAFSHNVVTNLNESGPGSLRMFIRAANAISGPNALRFIPVVAPNMNTSATTQWWRLSLTGTGSLPAITGDTTTIDGDAFYYRNGTLLNKNQGNIFGSTPVGVSQQAIPALERPEWEILENLGANESTLEIQGNGVTIQGLAFTSQNNLPTIASYHIRQSSGISLTVQDVVIGYDMSTNSAATNRTLHGIQVAYATPTTGTGTISHNYIASNLGSILLSNSTGGAGNVVAANLGDWRIERNIVTGGIRLGAGTNRILISNNKSSEALVMAQSANVNTAVGNNHITENTLTSATSDIIRLYEADNNTITLNQLHDSAGSGVSITSGGSGNKISQNSFQNNQGNAIDLGDDGVTAATTCTGAGGANGGLGRPVIGSARLLSGVLTISGSYCNSGTFDLEFYKAAVSAGEGIPEAGEGVTHIGTLVDVSGGSYSNATLVVPGGVSLQIGDKISAIAIDKATGNTSEFSANYNLSLTISGKLFNDVEGTAVTSGPAFVGSTTADLHLYDYQGVHVATTMLNASGGFTFTNITNGTYYVAVNDFRGLATGAAGDGSLSVEQTYGAAGNGMPGSGPICVGAAPLYAQQSSLSPSTWTVGAQNGNPLAGPCYGGRSSNPSIYESSPTPPIGSSEHVIRILVEDNNVSDVAFGFSANVVTNLGTDFTQGTLASFLKLANTLSGPNVMHFVPVQASNQSSGASTWWQLTVPVALPQITAAETTVSGIAYSNSDGLTILDTNKMTIGTTSAVGVGLDGRSATGDEEQISSMSGPELAIKAGAAIAYGLDINTNNVTIQNLAIYGFGSTTLPNGTTNFGETGNILLRNNVSNVTITETLLGSSAGAFVDPGSSRTKGSNLIFEGTASNVTISHNRIGFAGDSGLLKYAKAGITPLTNVIITGNEIRGNGLAPAVTTQGAGLELNNATLPATTQSLTINKNLIVGNATQGIELDYGRGITIKDNTIANNGASSVVSLDERQNIQIVGGENLTVDYNSITGSVASDGIELRNGNGAGATPAIQVHISKNQFGDNRGQAINLLPDGVNLNNGNCAEAGQQNMLVDYPLLTLAEISGNTLKIQGSTCANLAGTVEIYKVAANSGTGETVGSDIYGEGSTFLGSFAVTGGPFASQSLTGVSNLIAGETVTAILIDSNGNTSEFSKNTYVYTPVTLTASPSVGEGNSGTITATINVTSLNPINVTLLFTNETASDNDYTKTTSITIPAGALHATIPFTIVDDTTVEDDERFLVNVIGVENGTNGATAQAVTIVDNDFTSVTLSATASVVEGQSGVVTATLASLSVKPVNITLVYTDVTTTGNDYVANLSLVIPGGQQAATVPFQANVDNEIEATETLQVAIASAHGANNLATRQTITILNDTDHDLVADLYDSDDDGDGLSDTIEGDGVVDTDNDGKADSLDTDSDNDNIPDAIEGHDANGDGTPDQPFAHVDANKNGLDDTFDSVTPSLPDSDSDEIPNYRDNDDDNDGKLTNAEDANGDGDSNPATNPTDGDGDQIADYLDPSDTPGIANGGDSDGDGIMDAFEFDADGNGSGPDNTDGDGKPDYLDTDDDNDSVLTTAEFADTNSDGNPADARDTDSDGTPDYRDNDDDNDSKPTATEVNPVDKDGDLIPDYLDPDDTTTNQNGGDSDGDGVRDAFEYDVNNDSIKPDDTDGDGRANYLDNDDDNDGALTSDENADPNGDGNPIDALQSDGDGTPDYLDSDSDKDGIADGAEYPLGDSDLDSKPDYRDDDDDNDGILTKDEQPDPNGDKRPEDAVDHDGDGLPDYLDKDDDNDGTDTFAENNIDADNDGILDYLDPVDDAGNANGGDSDGDGLMDKFEVDVNGDSQGPDDTDQDGKPNYWDNDDDGDTILTNQEFADPNGDGNPADAVNTDGDPLPNYRDKDDDNDGKLTSSEGPSADADGDKIVDYLDPVDAVGNSFGGDSDGDGVMDAFEFDVNGDSQGPDDSDGDGKANYLDTDDDGDGKLTNTERADLNGDGNPADAFDTDGDGVVDYLDSNNNDGLTVDNDGDGITTGNEDLNGDGDIHNDDTDGDGIPNYLDSDDDGDTIPSKNEDLNGDGNRANDDTDGDGKANYLDNDDDGDTILTKNEDLNGDGNLTNDDTDGDGKANYLDNDDDGDTILTKNEDLNGDGNPANDDSDGDGKANYLDNDDDNDGILTKAEDANGDGNPTNDDADQDGTPDYLDSDSTLDSDGDGIPDNVDTDDDNDGVADTDEGNGSLDTDGDGKSDVLDTDDDGDGVETKVENTEAATLLTGRSLDGGIAYPDTDHDGIPNFRDSDDDGDGVLTKDELVNGDTDGDGVRNYLDSDDDGDGIPSKVDNTGLDPADTNLIDDDTDGDGIPNYLDSDDDGDTIPTKDEDLNGDGDPTNDDTDSDGIANALDEDDDNDGVLTKDQDRTIDSDGDGIPDYADTTDNVATTPTSFRVMLPVVLR